MLFLMQKQTYAEGGPVHFLDWSSSTSKRVVRSTPESAAVSKCYYNRAVSDCRSMVAHIQKTGASMFFFRRHMRIPAV